MNDFADGFAVVRGFDVEDVGAGGEVGDVKTVGSRL